MSDVCLLLEGTYPYVSGGVSTWVYDLIRRLPDITFSIVYLGAHQTTQKKMHYPIPENVVDFREIYLFDYDVAREKMRPASEKDFAVVEAFLSQIKSGDPHLFDPLVKALGDADTRSLDLYDLAHSPAAWKMIERLYLKENPDAPFIDYFWTWRFIYLPFFALLRNELPPARVYHSASTGYAGVLGALGKLRYSRPFLVTEHGIYTRERKIEIAAADWIYSEAAQDVKVMEGKDFFKEWWISLFSFFSRLTYDRADEIITLYEGNRRTQIEEGAEAEKIRIIPNGVDLSLVRPRRKDFIATTLRIGFVGRVVPIKDVKTFIRACKIVHSEIPNLEVYILGPTDEEEDYFEDCLLLTQMESLQNVIKFTGKVSVHDYYPKLDVLVLTSISEGQPIVMLEAGAYGIPVVTTDVGSCAELILGNTADDRLLGPSGIVTPICDAQATASAILRLLKDPALAARMGEAGRRRITSYYQMDDLVASYQTLYSRYTEEVRWRA